MGQARKHLITQTKYLIVDCKEEMEHEAHEHRHITQTKYLIVDCKSITNKTIANNLATYTNKIFNCRL